MFLYHCNRIRDYNSKTCCLQVFVILYHTLSYSCQSALPTLPARPSNSGLCSRVSLRLLRPACFCFCDGRLLQRLHLSAVQKSVPEIPAAECLPSLPDAQS